MDLQELKDAFCKDLYGYTVKEACAQEICVSCKKPALENCYSEAGIREYKISGLCEKCFDKICGE